MTPQSARSPTSPFRYTSHSNSNPQILYEYPSPAQSDSLRYRAAESDSLQGLGLYSCPLSRAGGGPGSASVTSVQDQSPPPATHASSWSTTIIADRSSSDTSRTSSHSTPNLQSTDYDPWVSFPLTAEVSSAPFSHDIYGPSTAAECAILPASPVPSGNTSQRSSFSSAPPSDILTQAGSIHSYTPRIKMEDHSEYAPGSESMMMGSPQFRHGMLGPATGTYPGTLDATFYADPPSMEWGKMEYGPTTDLPSISSLSIPHYDRRSESRERRASSSKSQASGGMARVRQPRKLTSKEDANFQCQVKGCEKFFGRSYNFKAHMETHDTGREYPFPCPLQDCNKKFVRKTDLQRHHQSVHMKQRNHKCEYCSRFFARKDTLRR